MPPVAIGGMILLSIEEVRNQFPAPNQPSLRTLRRLVRSGTIQGRKLAGSWYVAERSLQLYFREAPPQNPTESGKGIII